MAIGGFVGVGAGWIAKIKAHRVCPERWIDNFDVVFGDEFWVITVFLVKAFFQGIVHSIDSGFAIFVALHGVNIGFLNEKENN